MNCEQAAELLQDDLDGRLDAAAKAALDEHVSACAACAREAAELGDLRRLFQAVPPVSAPAGFADGVLAALPPAAPPARVLRMPRWAGPLVALAAVALIAVTVSTNRDRADRPAETAATAPATAADGVLDSVDADALTRLEEGVASRERRQAPEAEKKALGKSDAVKDAAQPPPRPAAASRTERAPAKKSRAPAPEPAPDTGGARAEGIPPDDAAPEESRDAKSADNAGTPEEVVVAFRDRAEAARFKAFLERRKNQPAVAQDEEDDDAGDGFAEEQETAVGGRLDELTAARAQLLATVDVEGSDVRALVAAYDRGNPQVLDGKRARAIHLLLLEAAKEQPADDGPTTGGGGAGAGSAGVDKRKRAKGEEIEPDEDAPATGLAGRKTERGAKPPAPTTAPEAPQPAADPVAKGVKVRRVRVVIVVLEDSAR